MEKYLVFKNLIQNLVFSVVFLNISVNAFALAGRQLENDKKTSSELVVRHVLNMQQPPFINLTPSRPTVVQFPSEVSNCIIKSDLVSISYGNGVSQNNSSSTNFGSESKSRTKEGEKSTSNISGTIYSSVTLSVKQIDNFTYEDLINTPETYMICSIRANPSDKFCEGYNDNQNTYCYVTVGIRVSDPNYYNAIVYLDKPGSVSALAPLPERRNTAFSNNFKSNDFRRDIDEKIHKNNINPIELPQINTNTKSVIVRKTVPTKNLDFKIKPLPKNSFNDDRALGLQADIAMKK